MLNREKFNRYLIVVFFILNICVWYTRAVLLYPVSSVCGPLFALAVPLLLPNFNIFMSYNFEANYNLPQLITDFTSLPAIIQNRKMRNIRSENGSHVQEVLDEASFNKTRATPTPLITRWTVYKWIEEKIDFHEYDGKSCLQRAICEHAFTPLAKYNSVFGDILHVLLSPHTTQREAGTEDYFEAEEQGHSGDCSRYSLGCEINILDLVSNVVNESESK